MSQERRVPGEYLVKVARSHAWFGGGLVVWWVAAGIIVLVVAKRDHGTNAGDILGFSMILSGLASLALIGAVNVRWRQAYDNLAECWRREYELWLKARDERDHVRDLLNRRDAFFKEFRPAPEVVDMVLLRAALKVKEAYGNEYHLYVNGVPHIREASDPALFTEEALLMFNAQCNDRIRSREIAYTEFNVFGSWPGSTTTSHTRPGRNTSPRRWRTRNCLQTSSAGRAVENTPQGPPGPCVLFPYQNFYNIAVRDDIFLADGLHETLAAGGAVATDVEKGFPIDDLGSDEETLKVGVDGAGSAGDGVAFVAGPGAALFVAGGEE